MTETPINVLKRARDLMVTDIRRLENIVAGIDEAIDALQPKPNAHKANMFGDEVVMKPKGNLCCEYCGVLSSEALDTQCRPPFKLQSHLFSGEHPADKFISAPLPPSHDDGNPNDHGKGLAI